MRAASWLLGGVAALLVGAAANAALAPARPRPNRRRRRTSRRRRRTSRNVTKRKGPRTGLIELPEDTVDEIVEEVMLAFDPVPGTKLLEFRAPHGQRVGTWNLPHPLGGRSRVFVEVTSQKDLEGRRGTHKALWERGRKGSRRTSWGSALRIAAPPVPVSRTELRDYVRAVVGHELTHATDPGLRGGRRRRIGEKIDRPSREWGEYFSSAPEVTAFLRSIEAELTRERALELAMRHLDPLRWAEATSSTYRKVWEHRRRARGKGGGMQPRWSDADRRRAMNVVASVWERDVLPRKAVRDADRLGPIPQYAFDVERSRDRRVFRVEVWKLAPGEIAAEVQVGRPLKLEMSLLEGEYREYGAPLTKVKGSQLPPELFAHTLGLAADEACERGTVLMSSRKPSSYEQAFWDAQLAAGNAEVVKTWETPRGAKRARRVARIAMACPVPVDLTQPRRKRRTKKGR
ncbi:MAG TPA: hypothetical protein VIY27_06000 [Myxococcota bacterium]